MRIVQKRKSLTSTPIINSRHPVQPSSRKCIVQTVWITFELPEWIGQFKRKWTHAYQCSSSNQKFENWENTEGGLCVRVCGRERELVFGWRRTHGRWMKLNFWFLGGANMERNSFELHQSYSNAVSSNDVVCTMYVAWLGCSRVVVNSFLGQNLPQ